MILRVNAGGMGRWLVVGDSEPPREMDMLFLWRSARRSVAFGSEMDGIGKGHVYAICVYVAELDWTGLDVCDAFRV